MRTTVQLRIVRDLEELVVFSTGLKRFNIYSERMQLNQSLEKPSTTFSTFNETEINPLHHTLPVSTMELPAV